MAEQINHSCPECEYQNYKIVPQLTEYLGTSAEIDDPPEGYKRLPVACQRHGCNNQYHIYLKE